MRVRTLEIRWHDSKPISTCDFQPLPSKKARPTDDKGWSSQTYRLATGGEDNNVRIWLVHPNILPPHLAGNASSSSSVPVVPHPPRVEYLATLSRHSAPVNVVRFSPNGELIASAGDDGMIIVWSQTSAPHNNAYGSDSAPDELIYEKEFWKARTPFRCTTMQVYDIAWSPTGEYIIAGSTDNTARIFTAIDGKCVREIAEHSHYVQGVAWDPLNEYIATQSSDRSVHVHSISTKQGNFEAHAIGKNTRIAVHHSRTPSSGPRPRVTRRESTVSDAESVVSSVDFKDEVHHNSSSSHQQPTPATPLTPAPSIASTPSTSVFLPPPADLPASRRSSFSSQAPNSPPSQYSHSHYGRSPSPMPPLPAIRAPPTPLSLTSARLYGDESFTNFFRRLTFSPDGAMLLTPAGQFEDPSVIPGISNKPSGGESFRGRRGNPADSDPSSLSSVFIYTRANFARPPIAQLPGHKKASVAVKFSPILYDLRPGVVGEHVEAKNIAVERGQDDSVPIDLVGPLPSKTPEDVEDATSPSKKSAEPTPAPTPVTPHASQTLPSPALSAVDSFRPPTPASSVPPTHLERTASVFALPYRMLFAIATMDTISIHDTQQAGPICIMTKLHYDEFTDMTWSPDGQCLLMTSRDGYCTIAVFDEPLPAHHTQQQGIQLQSIANAHSHSHSHSASHAYHPSTPSSSSSSLPQSSTPLLPPTPTPLKRSEPLSTPAASSDDNSASVAGTSDPSKTKDDTSEPPKKKRRVALTHIGGLGS
ncbi:WD40 repeat-like protein [Rickenella mellea]|uniref:WD40 repeat-like protein n=1 Tax=Rickenella mellea TaxID=50990 RepID=A0A4Y7QKC2_9AGAM|nr:WD40 repeat-like protein [Rickenella mellea]